MRRKESRGSRICRSPRSFAAVAVSSGVSARGAGIRPIGTRSAPARSMTWATWPPTAQGIWWSATRSIAARGAATISMPTCRTWPRPTVITPAGWYAWRCGWWSRMACRIAVRPGTCGVTTGSLSPLPRFRTGWKRGGKRAAERIAEDYLDDALADFSCYIAADELYDGPYCILSIVDNHRFQRLVYEVLDHNPTEEDITKFFQRFHEALKARGLTLAGITTDGSPLYPATIAKVFGAIPHQFCQYHVIAELNKSVLKAVAKVRRQLKATLPKLGRGRPTPATRQLAAQKKRIAAKVADLFEHRHLFVGHQLTPGERKALQRITRGQPGLRTLRQIVDE